MYLADFHVHSTFSDGKLTIPQLVDFYGNRGFGALAITDHLCETNTVIGSAARYIGRTLTSATFPIYQEILKSEALRAWKQYKLLLIPGVELTKNAVASSDSAHMLYLGISEWINPNLTVTDLTNTIRSQGGISIAAHPVFTRKLEKQTYYLWRHREELKNHFDAWEVASGKHLFGEVLSSALPKIANSDLHHPKQIRAWKTVFNCSRNQDSIFNAIRKQNLSFHFYKGEST